MAWLLLVLGIVWLIMWCWVANGWSKIQPVPQPTGELPISVIVAAHNEGHTISGLLGSLTSLRYQNWELILVLDRCSDNTRRVVETYAERLPIRILELTESADNWSPKKWAVTQGVAEASHNHLVFTDADCRVDHDWLTGMNAQFQSGAEVVLGIGLYESHPGQLNLMIQSETAFTAFQYIGAAAQGRPYMAVGRNMGYTKEISERVGGLESHKEVLSGDDDLFVQSLQAQAKIGLMTSCPTVSVAPRRWKAWLRQKTRHVSSSHSYSATSKYWLALFHGIHGLWWLLVIGSLITNALTFWAFFALYILRIVPIFIFWKSISKQLHVVWYDYPVLDFRYFLYNLSVIPWGLIRRPAWT